jgi:molecular chaperone DnaK
MVKDAEAHAEEDRKRRELVDLRNQSDSTAYNLEKLLNENREKLGEAQAKEIEETVAEARKAAEGEDAGAIRSAMDRLTKLSHRVAESLYKTASPPPGGEPGGGPTPGGTSGQGEGGGEGDVVDAEYTVKH